MPEVRLLSQKEIEALVKGSRGLILVLHDISERKEAEDALSKVRDDLEMRVKELTVELQRSLTKTL